MRPLIVAIVVVTFLAFAKSVPPLAAAPSETAGAQTDSIAGDWRRTALGWERRSWFCQRAPVERASYADFPHPAAIAALQGLLSLAALVAFHKRQQI